MKIKKDMTLCIVSWMGFGCPDERSSVDAPRPTPAHPLAPSTPFSRSTPPWSRLAGRYYHHQPRPTAAREDMPQSSDLNLLQPSSLRPPPPELAATHVSISKQYILQMSVAALGVTASHLLHFEEDEDAFFATVQIHVPTHENIPQFETTIFAGQYCPTADAALESASLAALLYMQTSNILIVDDLNFPELQKSKKEVVRARSWSDIFQHQTTKLKTIISSLERELASLKESTAIPMPIQQVETTKAASRLASVPYEPSATPPQHALTQNIQNGKKRQHSPDEPDAHATTIHQASTHQFSQLLVVPKKYKKNNKGGKPSRSTTTSAQEFPFRAQTRTDGFHAKRALFAPKSKDTSA